MVQLNKIPKSISTEDNLITITHTFLENIELEDVYSHPFEDIDNLTSVFKLDEIFENIYTSYLEFADDNIHYPYIDDSQFYDYLIHNFIRGTSLTLPEVLPQLNWGNENTKDNLNYVIFNQTAQTKILKVLTQDNILNPKLIELLAQHLTGFNDIKLVGHLLLEEILPVKKYSYGNLLNFKRPEYIKGFFSMKGTQGDLDYLLKFIGYDSNVTHTNKSLHHIENIELINYTDDITEDEYIDKIISANNLVESYNEDNLVLNIQAELGSSNFQGLFANEIKNLTTKLASSRMPFGSKFREFNFSGRLSHNYDYKVEETKGVLMKKVSEYDFKVNETQETLFNTDKKECVDWGSNYFLVNNGCSERYVDNTRDTSLENKGYEDSSKMSLEGELHASVEYNVADKGTDEILISTTLKTCPDYMLNGYIRNIDECALIDNKVGEVKYIEEEKIIEANDLIIIEKKSIHPDFWLTYTFSIENDKDWYVMNDLGDARIPTLDIANSDSLEAYRGFRSDYDVNTISDDSFKYEFSAFNFSEQFEQQQQETLKVTDRNYYQLDYAMGLYSWELDNNLSDEIRNNYSGYITNRKLSDNTNVVYNDYIKEPYIYVEQDTTVIEVSKPSVLDVVLNDYIVNADDMIDNVEALTIKNEDRIIENNYNERELAFKDEEKDGIFKLWTKYVDNIKQELITNGSEELIQNRMIVPESLEVLPSHRDNYSYDLSLVEFTSFDKSVLDELYGDFDEVLKDRHFYQTVIEPYLSRFLFVDNSKDYYINNASIELVDNGVSERGITETAVNMIADKFVEIVQTNIDNHLIVGLQSKVLDKSRFDELLGNEGFIDNTTLRFINNIYDITINEINPEKLSLERVTIEDTREAILGRNLITNHDELLIDNDNLLNINELSNGSILSISQSSKIIDTLEADVQELDMLTSLDRDIEEELKLVNNEQLFIESHNTQTDEIENYVLQDVTEANLLYGGLVINGDNITFYNEDYEIYPYYIGFDYIFYKVKTEN